VIMAAPAIYLDYNASAPVRPQAREAALAAMDLGANPSSVHEAGRRTRALVERAREDVAGLINCAPERVIFTSGCSEANALAILGGAGAGLFRRLIVFSLEHESAHATARQAAERFGLDLAEIRSHRNGTIDLAELDYVLAANSNPALVSVMGANNETGVVQPLAEVGEMCALRGARLHVDAAQIAGRLPFDAAAYDFVTLSAHKIGGLQGAGALVLAEEIEVEPLWGGGAQERRRRPGTEAVAAIAAFGAAACAAAAEIGRARQHAIWRDAMEARLADAVPGLQVFGRDAPRLPQTSCLGVPGLIAETQLGALDLEGIAVGAGAACSSGKVAPSHVLSAMGAGESAARAAIRVSFGWATQETELDRFTEVWTRVLERSLSVRRERAAIGA
jgi:cysteine desulfurase